MRLRPAAAAVLLLAPLSSLAAHDLFFKLNSYLLPASAPRVRVPVLNGTFAKSEAGVAPDRVASLTLVGPDGARPLAADAWEPGRAVSAVTFPLGAPGTYLVGASTRPRTITLAPAAFAAYLREEGLDDALAARRASGDAARPARERYAKHVKAVFQKGAPRTGGFDAVLGHPAELVPLVNPYTLAVGDTLVVRCLLAGRPAAGQLALAGGTRTSGAAIPARRLRADSAGVVRIPLVAPGRWYAKLVHLRPLAGDPAADYESQWATISFGVRE